jgi:catechol 2,3-dioxygenase-like lactoylglutathione lyase family enzyme
VDGTAAYLDPVTPTVQSMVSVTYVRDIDASRGFYELLGFAERSSGRAEASAWSNLHHAGHALLLASTRPPLDVPRLPLLFYFYVDDMEVAVAALEAAGVAVSRVGHPPHALGGETKVLDPDGNTVLLGQRERSASQPDTPEDEEASPHFSLLKEAAAAVSTQGAALGPCQVTNTDATPCARTSAVKLTDSWGETVWTCIPHADEILVMVPGAFIASQRDQGLTEFLARRRR